jgi:pimeloyl-ACP methyl ester carboxylesterase
LTVDTKFPSAPTPAHEESPYSLARYDGAKPPAPAWFGAALAAAPERTRFLSQGAEIELLTWGEVGKPGLLFLHGNGAHADWWSFIAPFFAADWRCAAISWSGMGGSAHRQDGYTSDQFAQEAHDAVAAAGLDAGSEPPLIIAHSLGGMIGLIATIRDNPFGGIIMIDSPVTLEPGQVDDARKGPARPPRGRHPFATLAEGLARFRLSPHQACENHYIVDHVARWSLREDADGWRWRRDMGRELDFGGYRPDHLLRQTQVPAAYLYGAESALARPQNIERARPLMAPGAPIIAIPEAAHHVPLDQPLALVAALRALLTCWPDRRG